MRPCAASPSTPQAASSCGAALDVRTCGTNYSRVRHRPARRDAAHVRASHAACELRPVPSYLHADRLPCVPEHRWRHGVPRASEAVLCVWTRTMIPSGGALPSQTLYDRRRLGDIWATRYEIWIAIFIKCTSNEC